MAPECVYETPVQDAKTSLGDTKFWVGRVLVDGDRVYTQTEQWQNTVMGGESVHQFSAPKTIKGKNIGKANETTPREQAISEMQSTLRKQQDKGYWNVGEERPESAALLALPMLAHKFKERHHNIKWPAYIQPKLDGVRMLMDGEKAWTRGGKLHIPECVQHLMFRLPEGVVLDGELMLDPLHYTFQQTVSAIKKFDPELSPKLEYHVYDIMGEMDFTDRMALLHKLLRERGVPERVGEVPTQFVSSAEAMWKAHEYFTAKGYEGTMVRNAKGAYTVGFRSADLQKVKNFEDNEFTIVDVIEGTALFEGTAIFICASWDEVPTPDGNVRKVTPGTFKAVPKVTLETRKQMWQERESLIGKKLTVRHQGWTDDGKPRGPVAIAVRDYE